MSRVVCLKTVWSVGCAAVLLLWSMGCSTSPSTAASTPPTHLQRAKIFLAAGDYRRAVEACRQEVQDHPSARSYLYLTYVYQALDAYVESLAKADHWVAMEHLYLNLSSGGPEELLDPPNVLARMAKEMIQAAARQQSDVTSELATRLDRFVVAEVWPQQTAWRKAKPEGWWFMVPPEWPW
jgi:hypothetical protein